VTSVVPIRDQVPVEEYLRLQKRYAHLFREPRRDDVITALQDLPVRTIERYDLLPTERAT
jgi:pyruvate ferredoxin oxidoreductase beta subunit